MGGNWANLKFTSDYRCLNAYKEFLCHVNFPPCDPETDETQEITEDDCANFVSRCSIVGYECSGV